MESNSTSRNVILDVAKGMAIILVVFGHGLESYMGNWATISHLWYWTAIHHFHMALFFFISGYLAFGKMNLKFLQRRSLQLIPPFLVWTIILYFAASVILNVLPLRSTCLKTLAYSIWTLNTSGLWFLPALLGLFILLYLSRGKLWAILLTLALAYILSQFTYLFQKMNLPQTAWFSSIAWFLPSFAIGYYIAKYKEKLHIFRHVKWACLVAFPLLFWLGGQFNYNSDAFSWPAHYAAFSDFATGGYRLLMALLGIGMTFAMASLITRVGWLRRVPQYLGGITLGIYCAHGLFRGLGFGEGFIRAVTMTVIALVLSTVLVWLLGRLRVTDFLFLGGGKLFNRVKRQPDVLSTAGVMKEESRS